MHDCILTNLLEQSTFGQAESCLGVPHDESAYRYYQPLWIAWVGSRSASPFARARSVDRSGTVNAGSAAAAILKSHLEAPIATDQSYES